ncbi:MAG: TlpA disulfide reductase family protein [Spirochaetia bacterium]|jgi:thioredoxin-related protein
MRTFPVLILLLNAALIFGIEATHAVSSSLPADLDASFQAFLDARAADKDAACNKFLEAYVPYLRSGADAPRTDAAIAGYLSFESLSNLVARLAIDGIFSPLQEACVSRLDSSGLKGFLADYAYSAKALYSGLKLLSEKKVHDLSDWRSIARCLYAGWRYFPSALYADQLQAALWKSKDKQGLFEFKAYRYFDESGPNPFRYAGLFLSWLFLPERKRFSEEMASVKETIKKDILRTSPGVMSMPGFGGELFYTTKGKAQQLAFQDKSSQLHGKRAVFVFFQTTCSYCIEELQALGRIVPQYQEKSKGQLVIIGLKIANGLPASIGALQPLEKRLNLPFPLIENDESKIVQAYNVKSVPLMIFFDERGTPLWTLAFRGQGHLEEKLSWFMDDFLSEVGQGNLPFSVPSGSESRQPISVQLVMDFYSLSETNGDKKFLEETLPGLQKKYGVGISITSHNATTRSSQAILNNRLMALHSPLETFPIAILGGIVLQGIPEIEREIPGIMADAARRGNGSSRSHASE